MTTRVVNIAIEVKGEATDEEVVNYLRNLNEDFEGELVLAGVTDDPWAITDISLAPKE